MVMRNVDPKMWEKCDRNVKEMSFNVEEWVRSKNVTKCGENVGKNV